jgi:hypothetical protein
LPTKEILGAEAVEAVVDRHVAAELTNEMDTVMATVSKQEVFYVRRGSHGRGTEESGAARFYSSWAGVKDYYETSRVVYDILSSDHLSSLTTDWYIFADAIGTIKWNTDGVVTSARHVVLLPVRPDGIVGELLWRRGDDNYAGDVAPAGTDLSDLGDYTGEVALPLSRRSHVRRYHQYLAAQRKGDAAAAAELFIPDSVIGVRPFDEDLRDAGASESLITTETADGVAQLVARESERFEITGGVDRALLADDWYVFAEREFQVRVRETGDEIVVRSASIFPIADDGRFAGLMSYQRVWPANA